MKDQAEIKNLEGRLEVLDTMIAETEAGLNDLKAKRQVARLRFLDAANDPDAQMNAEEIAQFMGIGLRHALNLMSSKEFKGKSVKEPGQKRTMPYEWVKEYKATRVVPGKPISPAKTDAIIALSKTTPASNEEIAKTMRVRVSRVEAVLALAKREKS